MLSHDDKDDTGIIFTVSCYIHIHVTMSNFQLLMDYLGVEILRFFNFLNYKVINCHDYESDVMK